MTTPGATTAFCLAAALDYATSLKWRVIPDHSPKGKGCTCSAGLLCPTPGKHPRIKEWTTYGTLDTAIIKNWWQQWPDSNIGLPTGQINGLVVLDVDPRHGGDLTLDEWETSHGKLPDTPRVLTGGGGLHIYLAYPPEGLGSCDLGPGVELKSDGSQVMAPPSLHYSDNRYQWELSSDPHEIPLVPMPGWLLALARQKAAAVKHKQNGKPEDDEPPTSPAQWTQLVARCTRLAELEEAQSKGQVGYNLWLQTGALAVHGGEAGHDWFLRFTQAYPAWRFEYEPDGTPRERKRDPQQGAVESRKKAAEWLSGGLTGPATCKGLGCDPTRCNFGPYVVPGTGEIKDPSPVRHFTMKARIGTGNAEEESDEEPESPDDEVAGDEKREVPPQIIDCPDLPEEARIDPGLIEDAGQWIDAYIEQAMAVSPMTPRSFHESAAYSLVATAVARRVKLQMAFGSVYPNLFVAWVAPTTLWHKTTALNYARNVAQRAFTHLLAPNEWTPESLLSDLSGAQPRNLDEFSDVAKAEWILERNFCAQRCMIQDEMSGLLASAGKEYNQGMIETLMQLFDCNPDYRRSTRGQGRLNIKHTYLTFLGASTPRALAAHFLEERLWAMGWWPRFALLAPEAERPEWAVPIDRDEPVFIVDVLEQLYKRLPQPYYPTPPTAVSVALGSGVFDAWQRYSKAMSYDLLTEDLDRRLWGTYGRLPVLVLKLSTLLAALDWGDARTPLIEMAHLSRAVQTAEEWRASAHRVLVAATSSDFDVFRTRILRQVGRYEPKGITMRDLCRGMRDKKPDEIEETVQMMVLAGDLESTGRKSQGGRPTERYRIARG